MPLFLPRSASGWFVATILFVCTLLTTTTLGAVWYLQTRTDIVTDLQLVLSRSAIVSIWTDPELLQAGLLFSVPALLILLSHELGHYFAARRHRIAVTPPFFLPLPLGLGTLGAFIRIRSRIRSRNQLVDVGAAGPISGFLALLPFLLLGVAKSSVSRVILLDEGQPASLLLVLPGKSLLMRALSYVFHGSLAADHYLNLHPFALAAWLGLLATSLNLLPVGQLDGGHILYALSPKLHRQLRWIFMALFLVGALFWPGWLLWFFVLLAMGTQHPPVLNLSSSIAPLRRGLALLCFAILLLSLMPVPFEIVAIAG